MSAAAYGEHLVPPSKQTPGTFPADLRTDDFLTLHQHTLFCQELVQNNKDN